MSTSTYTAVTMYPDDRDVAEVELDHLLPAAPFGERHTRHIEQPIEQVWSAVLAVTGSEIRALGPLMSLRTLPSRVLGGRSEPAAVERSLLDAFEAEGFVVLRRDANPVEGRALVVFGAAGRFWKPVGNAPLRFDDPARLATFDDPGHVVIAASVEAVETVTGTEVVTETRVKGTDRSATIKFAPYWALIRFPSGLIRRSWLAAIDRRSQRARG